jgi:hypothetical protein
MPFGERSLVKNADDFHLPSHLSEVHDMATLGDAPETREELVARLAEGRIVGHGTEALVERGEVSHPLFTFPPFLGIAADVEQVGLGFPLEVERGHASAPLAVELRVELVEAVVRPTTLDPLLDGGTEGLHLGFLLALFALHDAQGGTDHLTDGAVPAVFHAGIDELLEMIAEGDAGVL